MTQRPLTRRNTLALIGANMMYGLPASASDATEKKEFMKSSLEAVKQNGQKFERTTKMRFMFIPVVRPFGDWDVYYLMGSLHWVPNPGQTFKPVQVPEGFVTDLASVPWILWSKFPPTGRYAYAAIVHDYIYWVQDRPRSEADAVLYAAMADAKVDPSTISDFNMALTLAGNKAWNDNAKAKAAGEKRVLAEFPTDPMMSWEEWRKRPGVFR